MLTNHSYMRGNRRPKVRQDGVVLIIALIVLVAMTLAAVALVRSVDTNNVIAGNLAFQQSATHSADTGIERAITWLEDCGKTHVTCAAGTLENDSPTNGYSAIGSRAEQNPDAGQSWDAYWNESLANRAVKLRGGEVDTAKNAVSFVIDRMCSNTGSAVSSGACVASPASTVDPANGEIIDPTVSGTAVVYYRITVRVAGPRNTVSYVQAMVAM